MPMRKVAVVTGAARGLGRKIAIALAKEGFDIALHYHRSEKQARDVLGQIEKLDVRCLLFSADLTAEDEVFAFGREVIAGFGRVDLLVNNVGNFVYKKFAQTTNAQVKDLLESNVYSTLFTSRVFLPYMRKARSGEVVNIGAVGCERIQLTEKSTAYFMAKNGVYVITKIMAHEEARYGVRVNMISPASLETDIFGPGDFPMGRSASYDDVIKVLLFLISDGANYISGANIEVSGGFIAGF